MKKLLLIIIGMSAISASAQAQSLNFDFSFAAGSGKVVTGEIFGLSNNATVAPTSVVIFSDSGSGSGTRTSSGSGLTSDLTLTLHPSNTGSEAITVTNDQITAFNPGAPAVAQNTEEWTSGGTTPSYQLGLDIVDVNPYGGYFYNTPGSKFLIQSGSAATFTVASVPEPSSWALALLCVGLFVYLRRRAVRA